MAEDRHPGTPGGGSGADVKSGVISPIGDNVANAVTFGTAFATVPHVVACIAETLTASDFVYVRNVTVTGCEIGIHKGHGGSAHSWDVYWIATDAGDP